jgi:type IV pilus assembly protein PilB
MRCSSAAARQRIPDELAKRYSLLALGIHTAGDTEFMSALVGSELDELTIRELQFVAGCPLVVTVCDLHTLNRAIAILYAAEPTRRPFTGKRDGEACSGELQSDDSVSTLCRTILLSAIRSESSDIHIEYSQAQCGVRLRVRGELEPWQRSLSRDEVQRLCRHIKVSASLDITAVHTAQDGAFELQAFEFPVRVRVSVLPIATGEKLVLRLLHNGFLEEVAQSDFRSQLRSLGLFDEQIGALERMLAAERGATIVSGPVGSGKSTLLYVLMRELSTESQNVITLEDPVESTIPHACQVDLSITKSSFEEMLPRILRQDPDVVLVGEIRNRETAHTALQASLAGSKVFASVHAGSCFEVIARLIELGISPSLLGLSVRLISSQRLLQKNCQYCCYPAFRVRCRFRLLCRYQNILRWSVRAAVIIVEKLDASRYSNSSRSLKRYSQYFAHSQEISYWR